MADGYLPSNLMELGKNCINIGELNLRYHILDLWLELLPVVDQQSINLFFLVF